MPKGITLAEAAMPIDRERRMVRHFVLEIEATEPAIGKVKLHFLAQPALRTDAVAVADDQHPDHEFGVDRRPADLAVEGPQLLAKVSHYPRHHRIDAAKKMVPRNTTFEVEEIEQLALIDILPTHHDPPPLPRTSGRRNHDSSTTTSDFFNNIDPDRKSACCRQRLNGYDRSNTLTVEWPRPNGSPPTLAGPFRSYNYQQISLARLQTTQAESGDSSIAWV